MASLAVTVEQVGLIAAAIGQTSDESPPVIQASGPPFGLEPDGDSEAAAKAAGVDPLVVRSKEYATGSLRIVQALRPRLMRRGDTTSVDAADRIEETCISIASKIHRAVSGALTPDVGVDDVQADANGSAKVALLMIEESRQAWRTLMRPGHAVGNGTPARFVETLDALEAGLHVRFPRALEFVRPGFDTSGSTTESGLARAVREVTAATRH